MRNGMSVKEIRDRLDSYDALAKDYMNLVDIYEHLTNGLGRFLFQLDHTANLYANVMASPEATKEDKLEFAGKISGLKEAEKYILDILKDCLGTEESEETKNDLPGETEENESTV